MYWFDIKTINNYQRLIMVSEFLEELQILYNEKDDYLRKQVKSLQLTLKENTEFIKILESEEDKTYESFSPRKIYSKNQDKIDSLNIESTRICEKINNLKLEIEKNMENIQRINTVITEFDEILEKASFYDENRIENEKLNELSCEDQSIEKDEFDLKNQMINIMNRLELCSKIIDIDPVRCKMEISSAMEIITKFLN